MPGETAVALARAEHEIQLMLRRPAVQQAFDERGAQIVEAATGTPGSLRPLQREVLMRAAGSAPWPRESTSGPRRRSR